VNGSGHVGHFNYPYECEGKQVAQAIKRSSDQRINASQAINASQVAQAINASLFTCSKQLMTIHLSLLTHLYSPVQLISIHLWPCLHLLGYAICI